VFLIALFVNIGCSRNGSANSQLNLSLLKDYHQQISQPIPYELSENQNLDFYLDMTDGLKVAFQNKNSKSFFDNILTSLSFNKVDFYEVANNSVKPFPNYSKEQIFNRVSDPNNFSRSYAPFKTVIDEVLKNNSQAIFVTDGELWTVDNGQSNFPWAQEGFTEWLERGNLLHFYITDHPYSGEERHLYYIVFIPKFSISKNNCLTEIDFSLKNSILAKNVSYTSLSFGNSLFKIFDQYSSEKSGGVSQILSINPQSYHKDSELSFEVIEPQINWSDIKKYIKESQEQKGGVHFLRKIFLDNSLNKFYDFSKIDIKVYDIYEDFVKYQQYTTKVEEFRNLKPKFKTDPSGNRILDENASDYAIAKKYYDNSGRPLREILYERIVSQEVKELFTLDTTLYNNTYSLNKKAEIGIKIHPNFNGSQVSNKRDNLFKVDIVLKSKPLIPDNLLQKFIWGGGKSAKNTSLYNSILKALENSNLKEGKIIYTFYIKTLKSDL